MENYIVTQSRLHNLSNYYLVVTFEFNAESCDCSVKPLSDQARPVVSVLHANFISCRVGLVVLSLQEQLVVSVEGYRF